jgi:hypothetical protein
MIASVIDPGKLVEVVLVALLASVGVSTLFSLTILGATRASDRRREGATIAVAAYTCLTVISLIGCAAAIVYGLVALTQK